MATITALSAREILDSRGNPTVEATVTLSDGSRGTASVPSGASTGAHEAWELRDGDAHRYHGQGVLKAVQHIETEIRSAVLGMEASDQMAIDEAMIILDGTKNKSRLGANALLAVSLAVARAAAVSSGKPLYQYLRTLFPYAVTLSPGQFPVPMFNVINGGAHADSGLSVQEFKLVPKGIASYPEQLRAGSEIFQSLKKILKQKGFTTDVGDEGGFAPRLPEHSAVFEVLNEAVSAAGYQPGREIFYDIDAATDSFYDAEAEVYRLLPEGAALKRDQMIHLYKEWMDRYPLFSIEDPLHQDDFAGWHEFVKAMPKEALIIGDDLLVTNVERLQTAIKEGSCNTLLVKVNQIGTLFEAIACMALAKKHDMQLVVSHRSGETCDDFIADLAVAAGAEYIKTGSLSRGERLAKYNRLSEIYQELSV